MVKNIKKVLLALVVIILIVSCLFVFYFYTFWDLGPDPQEMETEMLYDIAIGDKTKIRIEKVDPWMSGKYIRIEEGDGRVELYEEDKYEISNISISNDSCSIIVRDIKHKKNDTLIIKHRVKE